MEQLFAMALFVSAIYVATVYALNLKLQKMFQVPSFGTLRRLEGLSLISVLY